MSRRPLLCLILASAWTLPVHAATPPPLVNYQGVLRDSADKPLTGTFDITFHFYDASSAGNEIVVDAHTTSNANPVTVAGGLFNALLGGGTVSDGSGPGFYTSLNMVFRDYDAVYLEVQVGGETLSPRTRVVAAPYAINAAGLGGLPATSYVDTTANGSIKEGALECNQGFIGFNDSGTGYGFGVWGRGLNGGGEFRDSNGSGFADIATGNTGIDATGTYTAGYFHDPNYSTNVYLANSVGYGIVATGTPAGEFDARNSASRAILGDPTYGVIGETFASGANAGLFRGQYIGGGNAYLGTNSYGIYATNPTGGTAAAFDNGGLASAFLATNHWGLTAGGSYCGPGCGGGGFFRDTSQSTLTYVAYSNVGIETHASGSGGSFYNTNGIATALAAGSFGVSSNGTKSFVQNHPDDPGAVVVYTALEGDEAGTYTRGTARLTGGEARIPLGESFKWVTNPDLGLTAHLTPVGAWADLYVASKSTREIIVKSRDPRAGDVAFDYIVFGLRVGFENNPVVRDKEHEMPIPAAATGEALFARRPDLRRFTAFSRFSQARKEVEQKDELLDLGATEALKARIHVFDGARDGAAFAGPAIPPIVGFAAGPGSSRTAPVVQPAHDPGGESEAPATTAFPPNTFPVAVSMTVQAGDVMTVTDEPDDQAALAGRALDKGVIGIVGGAPGTRWTGRAPLVLSGVVALCNVDATTGAIAVGDLLVSSSTPGQAMRANDAPIPGTVIAKALESLEAGTGTIRVLVLSR